MTDNRNDEFTKIEKTFNPKTKEELIASVQMLIFMYDLMKEEVDMLLIGHPAKLTKLFPGVDFTSVHGLLYRFMATDIDGFPIHCVAYDNGNENGPIQVVIYKRQNV